MFTADLHIHSKFSRATSKEMNLKKIAEICEIKGIDLVVTGDFVHPEWLKELKEFLKSTDDGFYKLKNSKSSVKFIIGGEISSIYKKDGKVRKIHNMIYMPNIESAEKLSKKLEKIGNIHSDGRPILGLDSKNLLELCLEINEYSIFIPAHIWTPWFSLFGKMSGFDYIEECFEEFTEYIYALETGLSSDPPMNWRLSQLDRFTLVSNSDAHSPSKIAREANIFYCEKNYYSFLKSLKDKSKVTTIEFFPEEGKYHYDGHRKCNVRLNPEEAIKNNNICPKCGRPVTFGVLHRVLELADRKEIKEKLQNFISLVPLEEIISQAYNVKSSTKKVRKFYNLMITRLGNELKILNEIPIDEIRKTAGELIAHGISKMRNGEIEVIPGYDGEYGKIIVINDKDREYFASKKGIFIENNTLRKVSYKKNNFKIPTKIFPQKDELKFDKNLNENQLKAIETFNKILIVIAGPGTGKTKTLISKIDYLLQKGENPKEIFAISFTNKACEQLKERISNPDINIYTFHSLSKNIIENFYQKEIKVIDPEEQTTLVKNIINSRKKIEIELFFKNLLNFKQKKKVDIFKQEILQYNNYLKKYNLYDFDDLLFECVKILENGYSFKIKHLLVDEFQDINEIQYELIKNIVKNNANLFVIGDPNQSIYSFRGGSNKFFEKLSKDFRELSQIELTINYRNCKKILNLSKKIIHSNLYPFRDCKGDVNFYYFENELKEANFIANEIHKLVGGIDFHSSRQVGEFFSFKDIAILVRANSISNKIKKIFEEKGIPYQESKDIPLEENSKINFNAEKVSILTMHAAKGLEFKVVFIVGIEDKIIPFSLGNFQTDPEEERRLLYVAITRAMDKLYITNCGSRFIYGEFLNLKKSKFLDKFEFKKIEKKKKKKIKTIF